MSTRKDHLVQLVAAQMANPTTYSRRDKEKVEYAICALAEIEEACPDTTLDEAVASAGIEDAKDLPRWCAGMRQARGKLSEAMRAVAAERERCAKIANYALQLFNTTEGRAAAIHIREEIRRGGA